jgi:Uma2 family endonuclease
LEDEKFDTLLNPSVLFEILSPSTRKADLFYKFTWYKKIPSLMEYIMIDSVRRDVEVAIRQWNGKWETKNVSEREFLQIRSIDYQMALDDIYKGTRFK